MKKVEILLKVLAIRSGTFSFKEYLKYNLRKVIFMNKLLQGNYGNGEFMEKYDGDKVTE